MNCPSFKIYVSSVPSGGGGGGKIHLFLNQNPFGKSMDVLPPPPPSGSGGHENDQHGWREEIRAYAVPGFVIRNRECGNAYQGTP
jgi:hypothetical protein